MEVHIFRAYARAELLILGTGDISGQITLCCGAWLCNVDHYPWFIHLDTRNSLPQSWQLKYHHVLPRCWEANLPWISINHYATWVSQNDYIYCLKKFPPIISNFTHFLLELETLTKGPCGHCCIASHTQDLSYLSSCKGNWRFLKWPLMVGNEEVRWALGDALSLKALGEKLLYAIS